MFAPTGAARPTFPFRHAAGVPVQPARSAGHRLRIDGFGRRAPGLSAVALAAPGLQAEFMASRIVVLGGGTGGTLAANRLRRQLAADDVITVVDRDNQHLYQPGLLFIPFGGIGAEKITRSRVRQLHAGVGYCESGADYVETDARRVHLEDGTVLPYDVLVIATGAALLPGETDGLAEATGAERPLLSMSLAGPGAEGCASAVRWRADRDQCRGHADQVPGRPDRVQLPGRLVFPRRGIRDRVELTLVTPLDGAFTKAACNRELSGMLDDKRIDLVTEFNTGEVDGDGGRLVSFDGREVGFDLAVMFPCMAVSLTSAGRPASATRLASSVSTSGPCRPRPARTSSSSATPRTSELKGGSVAHFEGEVLTSNIASYLAGSRWIAASMVTPTASSRAVSARPC